MTDFTLGDANSFKKKFDRWINGFQISLDFWKITCTGILYMLYGSLDHRSVKESECTQYKIHVHVYPPFFFTAMNLQYIFCKAD